jgi:vitamin B12 transporter
MTARGVRPEVFFVSMCFFRARTLCAALSVGVSAVCAAESLTVTGTRVPLRISDAVAEVTVIDQDALQRAGSRTLVELLSRQPGLQMSSNGGPGTVGTIFMRGLEGRHTLLLVDGVPVGSATLGTPSLDNLPLELIDHIEIVRGPMSAVYGSGAMGGVIQIFTRSGRQGVHAQAKAAAGSEHQGQVAAGVSVGQAAFDFAVSAQRSTTRGVSSTNPSVPFGSYNDDTDGFRQSSGSVKLGWQPVADWRLEWLSLMSRGETQFDDGPGADARAELKNDVHLLSLKAQLTTGWSTRLAVSEATDAYDTRSSASPYASLGTIRTRERLLALENQIVTPVGTAVALLERRTQKVSRPGAPFEVGDRDIDALALGLSGQAGGHSWQASLRRDRSPQFGGETSGALGWGYALTPAWRVLASLGSSHNLPTFNQLYYPGFGNPSLQPERGRHGEVGVQWTGGAHTVRAAYYEHRYRGFISSGPQAANLPYAHVDGVTLSWRGQWRELAIDASIDHTDPRNRTVGNLNFDKWLPRRAQDMARLGLQWQRGAWAFGADAAAFAHRFDDVGNTVRLGGYAVFDLNAEWTLRRDLLLALRLDNVADKRYQTALGYDQPGRAMRVSLRYTWP